MRARGALVVLGVSAACLVPATSAEVAGAPTEGPRGSRTGPGVTVAHGDRDRDRVDDAFEGRLRRAAAGERLDVIVTGLGVASSQRAVGRFVVRRQLPLVGGYAATMTAGQARRLAGTPGVRRVEPDGTMRILDDAGNADFGATQARADRPGLDGSGIGICVIDTGLDPNHEQFTPRTIRFADFVGTGTTPYDDQGHGTHVASIAAGDGTGGTGAATFVGVAPAADLYVAKVMDSGGYGSDSDIIAGIDWCHAQSGVRILSMSIGDDAVGTDGTDAVSRAVDAVAAAGDVVVAAAGNAGDLPGSVHAPGAARGAIAVGAASDHSAPAGTVRRDQGIYLGHFSSRGPTEDGRTKPDITAPGVSVTAARRATVSSYITYSGTSMATPYVAGALALALEAAPAATPAELRAALEGTAVDVGVAGKDNEYGAGLVDVRALVDAVAGQLPVRTAAFPTFRHHAGTVADHGVVEIPIEVSAEGLGVPIAVSMTVAGSPVCYYGCLIVEWAPDLDMELRAPGGTVAAVSRCPLEGLQCGAGRQETIGVRPTVAGTWLLRIWPDEGDPNLGKGGSFTVDVSQGPLAATGFTPAPTNQPPVADAGPDQKVRVNRKTKLATFTLDGTGSFDADGTIASYSWMLGSTPVGTTAALTLSRPVGTYTVTLTVTDDDGATHTDQATVRVVR